MERFVVPVLSLGAAAAVVDLLAHAPAEVIGVIVDVGHMPALDGLRDAVLSVGARRCHVVDAREAVAARACWPALRAGALGVPGAPLETALALPAVASAVIEMAGHEEATAVAPWADHAADRQRLRALLRALSPTLGLVSVASRARMAVSQNVWARIESVSGDAQPAPRLSPGSASSVEMRVGFERGNPRTLNGVPMSAVELIESLETVLHHAGLPADRVRSATGDGVWVVDAPAARVLHEALSALVVRLYDPAMTEVAATVADAYATVVRDGTWFGPLRPALDAFVDRAIDPATAEVTVRIAGGHIEVQT